MARGYASCGPNLEAVELGEHGLGLSVVLLLRRFRHALLVDARWTSKRIIEIAPFSPKPRFAGMARARIELATPRFSVVCSTN
jgi:hypothetical protein